MNSLISITHFSTAIPSESTVVRHAIAGRAYLTGTKFNEAMTHIRNVDNDMIFEAIGRITIE